MWCFPARRDAADEDNVPAAAVGRRPPSQKPLVSKVDTGPGRAVLPRTPSCCTLQAHVGRSQPLAEDDCTPTQRLLSLQPKPPSIPVGHTGTTEPPGPRQSQGLSIPAPSLGMGPCRPHSHCTVR